MQARKTLFGLVSGLAIGLMALPAAAGQPFANPGEDAGSIVGTPGQPARDIYPVKIVAIDGEQIIPREVFWIEPGKYVLTVSAEITNPGGLSSMRGRLREDDDINEIEVVVEAGKTYYIGAHFTGKDRRRPYNTVVYRVEDRK
ncbi:hypothetical protein [Wenzhouxiangella sp. EGI_FJ10409]|uniref:hypothetical protein n=1 Tax=Wenzhouxiangella sp. EGI_FJ10409 TaxID=3243767 RepID=UPI0035DC23B3